MGPRNDQLFSPASPPAVCVGWHGRFVLGVIPCLHKNEIEARVLRAFLDGFGENTLHFPVVCFLDRRFGLYVASIRSCRNANATRSTLAGFCGRLPARVLPMWARDRGQLTVILRLDDRGACSQVLPLVVTLVGDGDL